MINSGMLSEPNSLPPSSERLESWKEIAAYLKKGVRTVQRWERTDGLPVRRLGLDRTGVVFAYKTELDSWWLEQSRRAVLPPEPTISARGPEYPLQMAYRHDLVDVIARPGRLRLGRDLRGSRGVGRRSFTNAFRLRATTAGRHSRRSRRTAVRLLTCGGLPAGVPSIQIKSIGPEYSVRLTSSTQRGTQPRMVAGRTLHCLPPHSRSEEWIRSHARSRRWREGRENR